MYTHKKQYITAGKPVSEAQSALILIHGRGSTARNMIGLATEFTLGNCAVFAPQATSNSWYPYSFMVPDEQNQPALNSALEVINELVNEISAAGIPQERIYFAGFSQGACLTLEYLARNAKRYGGAVVFTGGLIGAQLNLNHYQGDFAGMKVLLTTSNPDMHVPLTRVEESADVLEKLHAEVTLNVYPDKPHSIVADELALANQIIFSH